MQSEPPVQPPTSLGALYVQTDSLFAHEIVGSVFDGFEPQLPLNAVAWDCAATELPLPVVTQKFAGNAAPPALVWQLVSL